MREIILIRQRVVTIHGRILIQELRCHGLVDEHGACRLKSCCGKWSPLQSRLEASLNGAIKSTTSCEAA